MSFQIEGKSLERWLTKQQGKLDMNYTDPDIQQKSTVS